MAKKQLPPLGGKGGERAKAPHQGKREERAKAPHQGKGEEIAKAPYQGKGDEIAKAPHQRKGEERAGTPKRGNTDSTGGAKGPRRGAVTRKPGGDPDFSAFSKKNTSAAKSGDSFAKFRKEKTKPAFSREEEKIVPPAFVEKQEGPAAIFKRPESSEPMRLNKYLSHCGIASRRAADTLIMQGHVTVNGAVVQEMGYKVQEKDIVNFKGKPIKPVEKLVYFLLNKPRNVLTTSADERGRKTVIDILASKVPERVYPVGRLDRNTSGLILLTNDGELTKKLSHPSHKVPKVYHVTLDKNFTLKDMETIRNGITLEDGVIKADSLHYMEEMSKRDVAIELHSGKNRIVRRIFESLGYEVTKLDRTYYAGLTKKNLPRGFFRPLTKEEVRLLKHFT